MAAATGRTMPGDIQLADRVVRINVSPTLAVLQEAERFKARGADVVDFGPGEPDFPTPNHIKRAAVKALEENKTKYTPTAGIAPLRQAICEWHAAQFGSSYQPSEVIVTVGGKHAIYNAARALLEKGETPPGVDPAHHRVRSAALVLRADQPFQEAARDALRVRPGEPQVSV